MTASISFFSMSLPLPRRQAPTSSRSPHRRTPITAATLQIVLDDLVASIRPPAATFFTARLLRSGGISAACAARVRLETIMRIYSHNSYQVLQKHYLDALMPVTPEARFFLGRFAPLAALQ